MLLGAVALAALGLGVVALAYAGNALLAPRWTTAPRGPWLSGALPEEHALSRFHVRWYAASIVFLAFDVEMLFMYPWVLVVGRLGTEAIVEMFAFLGALLVAVLWAWREGAFRWV